MSPYSSFIFVNVNVVLSLSLIDLYNEFNVLYFNICKVYVLFPCCCPTAEVAQ